MEMQRMTDRSVVAVTVGFILAFAAPAGAAPLHQSAQSGDPDGVTCRIEQAPMRDGVELATEVYLPPGEGPFPVILQRTPYNRRSPSAGSDCDAAVGRYFAERGYALLNQDTRGRYRSGGEFDAMRQEPPDGFDAVEWAAVQPWSNGRVGMIGGSYVGLTQWQAAGETPPHLVAIAPHYSSSDYHKGWTYQGGAFDLWFAQSWTAQTLAPDTLQRRLEAAGMPLEQVLQEVEAFVAEGREKLRDDWLWQLPLKDFAGFRRDGNIAAYYDEWLARPGYDDYWAGLDLETKYPRIQVPALITGGWYDIFQEGTIRNFMGLREEGGTEAARTGTQLVMRALCHACPGDTTAGAIDFGPDNALDLNAAWARWFDFWLKGIDNGVADDPPVRLFVMTPPDEGTMGGGFWIEADEFPLPDAVETRFYLRSGGHANSAAGDGALSPEGPGGEPDTYVYDPREPVPTVGGNMCCRNDMLASGAFDQRGVERRGDVLVYTTEPLDEDLTVIGPVQVELWAASSARDTDFTAKLVDVHLDGYAHNVSEGIVRARFRNSDYLESWITPGAVHDYTIDMGYTANVFRRGHRIRLEISSSNFPHFDRNLNTATVFGEGAEPVPATQRVLHDDLHPSQLVLQVAPDVRAP
ncbi:MAG: CocE/NonD family hydrolase [Acidobacteria bacterium]|nr:CocE/NonD family hydrolase [Acidobacteriota bacterium]